MEGTGKEKKLSTEEVNLNSQKQQSKVDEQIRKLAPPIPRYIYNVDWHAHTVQSHAHCSINVFNMLSSFAVFWYQILLSPICSCIHFQVWFYFTLLHLLLHWRCFCISSSYLSNGSSYVSMPMATYSIFFIHI